jgi:hypothetical protein
VAGHVTDDQADLSAGKRDGVVPVAPHGDRFVGRQVPGGEGEAGEEREANGEVGPLEQLGRLVVAGVTGRPGGGVAGQDGDRLQGGVRRDASARVGIFEAEGHRPAARADRHQGKGDDRAGTRQREHRLQAGIRPVQGCRRRVVDDLTVPEGVLPREGGVEVEVIEPPGGDRRAAELGDGDGTGVVEEQDVGPPGPGGASAVGEERGGRVVKGDHPDEGQCEPLHRL